MFLGDRAKAILFQCDAHTFNKCREGNKPTVI